MLVENTDYELIPADEDKWHVRILVGPYTETCISFGNLKVGKDDMLHFDFSIVESPDLDLTIHDETLQLFAADILSSILETATVKK